MPIVSEYDVRKVAGSGHRFLSVPTDAVIPPQALEIADRLGVELRHGDPPQVAVPGIDPVRAIQRVLLRRSPRWVAPEQRRGAAPSRFGRIAFVGSGMVGATTAHLTAISGMADELTLTDVVPGLAESTALDIEHSSGITGTATRARGGTSLNLVSGADVVVVTAGRPRNPGMTRATLYGINRRVIADVGEAVGQYAPHAVVIVITNPVDEMTYEMWAASGLSDRQVIGMAGTLDSSRFRHALARKAGTRPHDVWAVTMGSHGAEMVPIVSTSTIKGRPLTDVLKPAEVAACIKETVDGGASVVALRKTGSAFIAPAHATIELLDALRGSIAGPVPVSAMVHGEYGIEGVFLGVRARLCREGVAEIVEDSLDDGERMALGRSAEAIRSRIAGMPSD